MDDLARLLFRGRSGLYLLTGRPGPTAVERLCRLKGMRLFRIDGRNILTKRRFLAEFWNEEGITFHMLASDIGTGPAPYLGVKAL